MSRSAQEQLTNESTEFAETESFQRAKQKLCDLKRVLLFFVLNSLIFDLKMRVYSVHLNLYVDFILSFFFHSVKKIERGRTSATRNSVCRGDG